MTPGNELNLTHTQKLGLTPALRQALKILQYPILELREVIDQEILENPFLEEVNMSEEKEEETEEQDIRINRENTDEINFTDNKKETVEQEGFNYEDWKNYFESESSDSDNGSYGQSDEEKSFDNIISKQITLTEYLLEQLGLATSDSEEHRIGEIIIGNIDENGYLHTTIDDVVNMAGNTDVAFVEKVLQMIQTFDPSGVGARDLRECLLIQLKDKDMPFAEKVLLDFWSDFEKKHYNIIAKAFGISVDEIHKTCLAIMNLEPKPGRNFGFSLDNFIVPDVIVEKVDGRYVVKINEDGLPKLKLNKFYNSLLNKEVNFETKEYLKKKFQHAYYVIKGIEERRKNLLKVSQEIVDIQKNFLDNGIEFLKPLILKDIAERTNLHESTISRITSNKYIQTPHGFVPFKTFFSYKISKVDGDTSASSVKEIIKELIESEDHKNPLSDKKIVEELATKSISIARRTVAKYREEMNIQPSNMRINYEDKYISKAL